MRYFRGSGAAAVSAAAAVVAWVLGPREAKLQGGSSGCGAVWRHGAAVARAAAGWCAGCVGLVGKGALGSCRPDFSTRPLQALLCEQGCLRSTGSCTSCMHAPAHLLSVNEVCKMAWCEGRGFVVFWQPSYTWLEFRGGCAAWLPWLLLHWLWSGGRAVQRGTLRWWCGREGGGGGCGHCLAQAPKPEVVDGGGNRPSGSYAAGCAGQTCPYILCNCSHANLSLETKCMHEGSCLLAHM